MAEVETKNLTAGLTLVKINLPTYQSITNLLAVRSGSRYENAQNNGVAHFLEHLVFKGTKKFPSAKKLSEAIESVGGRLNAWTAHDHTTYHNVVPKNHSEVGFTLPFELAYQPLLKQEDMERERTVIIEEINRINDDPASLVDDLSGSVIFPNHPLGYPIIGTKKTIQAMTIQDFQDFHQKLYHPSSSLFITIGAVSDLDVESVIAPYLKTTPQAPIADALPHQSNSAKKVKLIKRATDQTHFIWAVANAQLKRNSSKRAEAAVLNTLLGRGMSSRLFLNIREKKGLAYAISSHLQAFQETGLLGIYGGVNNLNTIKALEAVREEIENLCEDIVTAVEFDKAREYIIGGLLVSHDDPYFLAKWYGVNKLLGLELTLDKAIEEIKATSPQSVRDLAREIFDPQSRTLTVIGPHADEALFYRALGE